MSVALSILAALLVAAALVVAGRFWFGRIAKRRQVESIGIETLGARHWRDALALLVEALGRDGLTAQAELGGPQGAPLGERILRRDGSTVLLIYKHGTAYRIGAPALRDAEKRRQEAGIDEVLIATLGSIDAEGEAQAARMRITCLDGAAVWARVGGSLDPATREAIDAEAEQRIDGPRRLSTIGAAVLGFAIVFWGTNLDQWLFGLGDGADAPAIAATAPRPAPASPAPSPAPSPETPAVDPAPAAADAPASQAPADPAAASAPAPAITVAEETPAERRRAALAKAIAALAEVDRASWSSASTLVLSINARSTIERAFERTCALAGDYPELREIRLQLEAAGGADVRWRRCG